MKAEHVVALAEVEQAYARLSGVLHRTPLDRSRTFSEMTGCEVYLKLENLQKTGSFKIRGAYNKIHTLGAQDKVHGVVAASAGNHAQGVAYAATLAGVKSTIVMPEGAPLAKVIATRGYGAEVVLSGMVYDDAYAAAKQLQSEGGQTFVHAFDDAAVVAGQGTIGLEILAELPDVDAIIAPVGGGGLISGIAAAVKERAPHVKLYGVQAQGADAMSRSRHLHQLVTTEDARTMADGIAVKVPGDLTFAMVDRYVDDVVTIDDETIAGTILLLLERAKQTVEGAGAAGLAALLGGKIPLKGKIAVVISGGNIDVNMIARIIERGLVKAGRRIRLTTMLTDRPGALQQFLNLIAKLRANVIHVHHTRVERHVPIGQALVEVSLETKDAMHTEEILAALREAGYEMTLV